jgi:hypothetical protein
LPEDIAGSEESLCCMEFRQTALLNCTYVHLIMICCVIILDTVIFNICVYLRRYFISYVLPEDGPRSPKHVGEIIMKKEILLHAYVQLVGTNTG